MEGIGANKEFVDFVVAVAMATDKSFADKKWDWSDLVNYWDAAKEGVGLVSQIGNMPKEWKDFSEDEIKVLKSYLEGKLDLSNDMLEAGIEAAYGIALNILKFASLKLSAA